MTTRALLRAAGLVAWAFAGLPAVVGFGRDPGCMTPSGFAVWAGSFAVFGVAFWKASAVAGEGSDTARTRFWLGLQAVAAFVMLSRICTGFETSLLVVVAVEIGLFLPLRLAIGWLLVQSVLLGQLAMLQMGWAHGLRWTLGALGFEAFAFTVAAIAGREVAARRELARANAELERAREHVVSLSRDAERLRIARELHDLLGHDLAALHLNLEAAKHLVAGGAAAQPIERAQGVARGLLVDLRKAVSALRSDGPVDVSDAVRAIAVAVTSPKIHIDVPRRLEITDGERANAILRCVQEVVTNTIKHAAASNLWIQVSSSEDRIDLRAHDDGQGSGDVQPGSGLTGMRERLEELRGELSFGRSASGEGFELHASLPLAPAETASIRGLS